MERNEAIEVIKKNYPHVTESGSQFETALRLLIPELKESEDERIKEVILKALMADEAINILVESGIYYEDVESWLEKQCEHANFRNAIQIGDKVIRNRDGMLVNLSQLKRVAKPAEEYNIRGIGSKHAEGKLKELIEKQGEQKPADSKIIDLDELVIKLEETIGTSPHSRETIKGFFQKAVQKYMNCLKIANGEIGSLIEENYRLKEKQGEQKPNIVPIFKVGDIIKNKKNGDTVKVEQILSDSYCYSGWDGAATIHSDFLISDQSNWELVEQNPAWSEEDDKCLKLAVDNFQTLGNSFLTAWLKGLKDKIQSQPKQNWNEEDENIVCFLINVTENYRIRNGFSSVVEQGNKAIDWLKSLKPQERWKPSEVQMDMLRIAVSTSNNIVLDSLYNDLMKLKG